MILQCTPLIPPRPTAGGCLAQKAKSTRDIKWSVRENSLCVTLKMVLAPDPSVLRGIPEFFESEVGEALVSRTESLATFRELGPPDLCHIEKTNSKAPKKDIGSYHFVLGTDASSSATLAAYLNSLTYSLGSFNPKTPSPWKIKSGTYCCFNAFSRVDVRVEVRIPGGVESYVVDLRWHPITNPAIWQETAVSSVLRSILDDNDEPDGNDGQPLLGLRKLDHFLHWREPYSLKKNSNKINKGWQLGTDPEVQVATYFSNHLTNGIMKYFMESGRLEEAAKFFEPLFEKDPEVGAVLARSYLGTDEEIKAVDTLYTALKRQPLSYGVLLVQIDFFDMALKLAKLAVTYAPSEYTTWSKLTQVYIELGDFESDSQRMPPPVRTHLPLKPDLATLKNDEDPKKVPPGNGTVYDENDPRENEIHPELLRLPALSLRGTFSKAYALLIRIVSKVGWDELLRFRSNVFVMEEEYRIHRAITEEKSKSDEHESGDTEESNLINMTGEQPNVVVENTFSEKEEDGFDTIALDATGESDLEKNGNKNSTELSVDAISPSGSKGITIDEIIKKAAVEQVESRIPVICFFVFHCHLITTQNPRPKRGSVSFSFRNKRLCEKWLDNLFMVLYNDLRLYTALKQEIAQYRSSFGDGKNAYRLCLDQKFSAKSLLKLLEMSSNEGNIKDTLTYVYPSPIARGVFSLIRRHGLAKVQNALISMNIPQRQYRLVTRYFE
ncbi:Chs5p-Arf1p-binding proteins-domain-containing protein [Chytridium lagenaria]|nr:Chs5p-Arf1p-binding proteins-domain-containing protein [Chytridium lagenaria]